MSDKNIDKDIEIVKSIINKMKKNKFIIQYKDLYINEEDIQVIENALSELEIKDKMIDKMCLDISNELGIKEENIKIRYRNEVLKDE